MSGSSRYSNFRNKGSHHSQKLATKNATLEKRIAELEEANKKLLGENSDLNGWMQIGEQTEEKTKKEFESAQAKIVKLESKKLDLEQKIVKYEDMEQKLMESKLSKFIKPIIHIGLVISERLVSNSKKMNRVQKELGDKKYSKDEVKALTSRVYTHVQKVELDLKSAEKKIGEQSDALKSSNEQIDKLKLEMSRLVTDWGDREKDLKEKIGKQSHQILSFKNQKKEKMQCEGYQNPTSVPDVLNMVEGNYSNIVVTKKAKKGSKKCKFERLEVALETLDVVAKRHEKWVKSGKNGLLDLEKDDKISGLKIDVANSDSKDRVEFYNGKQYIVKKHIRIGTAWNPKKCLRIYFETIDDELVIFYCDKHP